MPQKTKKTSVPANSRQTKKYAMEDFIKKVEKRDGSVVRFDFERIVIAINKAMMATSEGSLPEARMVANKVLADLVRISRKYKNFVPNVEGIQDSVEKELILSEYVNTAKAFILYRQKRAELRRIGVKVPEKVRELAADSEITEKVLKAG